MIDAQAVSAHLDELANIASTQGSDARSAELRWIDAALQSLPLQDSTDKAGHRRLTLRGATDRVVAIGCFLEAHAGQQVPDRQLGIVVGVEVLKALARFQGQPPCGVQLVIWGDGGYTDAEKPAAASAAQEQKPAAYLEVHLDRGDLLADPKAPLGVAAEAAEAAKTSFHPRLLALGEEAVRELTGACASVHAEPGPEAAALVRDGVPVAAMYVRAAVASENVDALRQGRLHLLQAAEAFGRWVEATVHMVAGDPVDLWAREHRLPHTEAHPPRS